MNKVVNNLPIELHLPGYQYCGRGTKLETRLTRGDPRINPLDAACKEHNITDSHNLENMKIKNAADAVLADKAWQTARSDDASIGEKDAAYAITNAMEVNNKLGMSVKKKPSITLDKVVEATSKPISPSILYKDVIRKPLKAAPGVVKKAGGQETIHIPRILKVPSKVGRFLPSIPIFARSLAGVTAGIVKALKDASAAKRQFKENPRHNTAMEVIALGEGLYLKPYKKGCGFYLKPYSGQGLTEYSMDS